MKEEGRVKEDETACDSERRRDGVEERSSREAVCSIVFDEEWAAESVSIGESEGDSDDDANDFEVVFVGGGVTDFVTVRVGGGVLDGVSENEFSEREEVGVL